MYSIWRAVAVCAIEYMQIGCHWHLSLRRNLSEQALVTLKMLQCTAHLSMQQYLTNAVA